MNFRRVANGIGFLVMLALVVPFVVFGAPGVVGADHSFVVLSGSMEPEISAGDVVLVAETDPSAIGEGDVVTFVRSDEAAPVTHRVIGIEEQGGSLAFETQGDANAEPDAGLVPEENLIGTVLLTIPFIGYVIQFVNTPAGFALFVGGPIGLLVLSGIRSFVRSSKSEPNSADCAVEHSGSAEASASTESSRNATASDSAEPSPTPAGVNTRSEEPSRKTDDSGTEDEVVLHAADLTTTLGVLGLVTAYSGYVVIQLQTPVTFTVAFAAAFSTLALGGLWLAARRGDSDVKRSSSDEHASDNRSSEVDGTSDSEASVSEGSDDSPKKFPTVPDCERGRVGESANRRILSTLDNRSNEDHEATPLDPSRKSFERTTGPVLDGGSNAEREVRK